MTSLSLKIFQSIYLLSKSENVYFGLLNNPLMQFNPPGRWQFLLRFKNSHVFIMARYRTYGYSQTFCSIDKEL